METSMERLGPRMSDSAAHLTRSPPESRLLRLMDEVYSLVEVSMRHQDALWGIVVLNSHEGPFQSDAIPPSLLPSLQAKMDSSLEFSQMALERLQEMRLLLVDALGPCNASSCSFPERATTNLAPPPVRTMDEASFRQGGGSTTEAFGEWFPTGGRSSSATNTAGPVCVRDDRAVPCSPKPVRPSMPLAPLKVPVRPDAYQGVPVPSPELNKATTPTVYTAFRGNTVTRAMAGDTVSPKPVFLEPFVPPSFHASSHFPEHNDSGANLSAGGGRTVSGYVTSLPQPLNTLLERGHLLQAQDSFRPLSGAEIGRDRAQLERTRTVSNHQVRTRRVRSPLASSSKIRPNPLGESKRLFGLQPGADPSKDIPEDGYSWRKYGQKHIRNCTHERGYYRCSAIDEDLSSVENRKVQCKAKKKVQRSDEDGSKFNVYYRGQHTCRRGRGSSSASGRGGDGGVVGHGLHVPQPRYPNLSTLLSRLSSLPLLEAQAPIQQAQQPGVEFRSATPDTGTSDSSKASDFVFDNDQDFSNLLDLPPFTLLQDSWEPRAIAGGEDPVRQMESLLLSDDMFDEVPKVVRLPKPGS